MTNFEFNFDKQFTFNGMLLQSDPMSFAPVEEGHEHYGLRLYEIWGMTETEALEIHNTEALNQIRLHRNALLAETDWWANSDLTMTAEQTAYRQALRDITNTYSSLDDVVWPEKP